MSVIKSVRATYQYNINGEKETITVEDECSRGKTESEWKISLCIDAGREVSKKYDIPLETIALLLKKFEVIK